MSILEDYLETFDVSTYPQVPMMQCTGYNDKNYLAMLQNAIERGSPVNDEDYNKYFPQDKDILY